MKTHLHFAAVLVLFLFGNVVRADQRAIKPFAKPVTIPFETLKTGHMAVKIKVNGKGPYRVIFDTGAPVHLLNTKLAKEAGLLEDAPASEIPFLGTIAEVKVQKLQVGDEEVAQQDAIVMDHPLVEMMSKKLGPLYGIVGFPFFARYRMTIDYQAETLTLVPTGFKPPNVMRSMQATLIQLMTANPEKVKVLAPAAQWGLVPQKKTGDEEAGVDIKTVRDGSAAAEAGLKAGDRLLTIDGRWTDTLPDLFEIAGHLKPGVTVPLGIKRGGKELELKIKLRAGL